MSEVRFSGRGLLGIAGFIATRGQRQKQHEHLRTLVFRLGRQQFARLAGSMPDFFG